MLYWMIWIKSLEEEESYFKGESASVLTASSYEGMLTEFALMQQFVADDVSVFPLAVNKMIGATRKGVEGFVLADTTNWLDFSTVRVPIGE